MWAHRFLVELTVKNVSSQWFWSVLSWDAKRLAKRWMDSCIPVPTWKHQSIEIINTETKEKKEGKPLSFPICVSCRNVFVMEIKTGFLIFNQFLSTFY